MNKNLLYAINNIEEHNVNLLHTFDKSLVIEFIIESIELYIAKILYFEEDNKILNKLKKLIYSLENNEINNYDFKTYTDDCDGNLMIDIQNNIIEFELNIFGSTNIFKHVTTVDINKL